MTICKAYESAKQSVWTNNSQKESEVFKILTQPNHKCHSNHIYSALLPGSMEFVGQTFPYILKIPNKLGYSYGRNEEMFHILDFLQSYKSDIQVV